MDMTEAKQLDTKTAEWKLSAAIRLGCILSPKQCTDGAYEGYDGSTCAYGAASKATGIDVNNLHFGGTEWASMADDAFHNATGMFITIANDSGWTREAIADKLEELGF